MFAWFTATVDWMAQWVPRPVATAILLSLLWFIVAVPTIKLLAAADRSWWRRAARQNRTWIIGLAIAGAALLLRGGSTGFADFTIVGAAALLGAGGMAVWQRGKIRQVESTSTIQWRTTTESHPGFPVITWTQLIDTGLQQKDALNRTEFNIMRGMLAGGPVLGWVLGGGEGALIGLGIAFFLLPAVNRYSVAPKTENVGGYAPMPGKWTERQPTELERQIEAEPITELWEAQAFIDTPAGADIYTATPFFTVQWRNAATGDIVPKCFEDWTTLSAFEFESHEKLFRDRIGPRKYQSPYVIITRKQSGHLIEVARDMTGQEKLQRVFVSLDQAFGPQRRQDFLRERDQKLREAALKAPPVDSPTIPDTQTIRQKPVL